MEGYKKLLVLENSKLCLDGLNLVDVASMDRRNVSNFFTLLHYRLVNNENNSCIIKETCEYNGLNTNGLKELYVKEDSFEEMRKDIFFFTFAACHKSDRPSNKRMDLYDPYQLLQYSDYLQEKGKYHNIDITKNVLYLLDDDFSLDALEDYYNRLYNQKVKKLNRETNC